jgi:hypothetical protein
MDSGPRRGSDQGKEPQAGSMRSHRRIVSTAALAVALSAAVPANAPGSSLLSGYGGPGAGNQAIIGATLLNGSGGGGSGGGSSSHSLESSHYSKSSGVAGSPSNGITGSGAKTGTEGSTARRHAGQVTHVAGGARASGAGKTSAGAAPAYPASSVMRARGGAVGPETLGLSSDDLLLILLALAGLAFTGVLTRRLARAPAVGMHRTLKRKPKGPE